MGSHPLPSLVRHEFEALAVVGPCSVVPRNHLPAAIAVTASVGMACKGSGIRAGIGGLESLRPDSASGYPRGSQPFRFVSPL